MLETVARRDGRRFNCYRNVMLDRLRARAPYLVLLLCLIVLAVRLSGAHAHRHVPNGGDEFAHHDAHAGHTHHAEHHDGHEGHHAPDHGSASSSEHVDVTTVSAVNSLGRLVQLDGGAAALLMVVAFVLLTRRPQLPAPTYRPPDRPLQRAYLRPLLRGPPPISVV